MIPTPKYEIGQQVFAGCAQQITKRHQCPDCLGTKEWEATTPRGEVFHIPCGTCQYGFFSEGTLQELVWTAEVRSLTIGSVQIDTADKDRVVAYMCRETGIGSGQVWPEHDLHLDHAAALLSGKVLASERNAVWQANEATRQADQKKKANRKPSWEKKRIRELEKQLAQLEKTRGVCEEARAAE
jgi:hypothetical protein